MPDFNVRSDSVNVEQIMEQIRARIREKRGVDYTEQQIRELAAVKLEKFLDPRGVRSDLLEQFRKAQPAYKPPELPNYAFEDKTLFESTRPPLRMIRRLLNPILKMFFNPNPLIHALNIQSRLNTMYGEREAKREATRRAFDQLQYELMHNLVIETTRMSIEVKNLKMRVESLTGRLEFNERRGRALESAVVYKPGTGEVPEPAPALASASAPMREPGPVVTLSSPSAFRDQSRPEFNRGGAPAGQPAQASAAQHPQQGSGQPAEGPGQRSRRRRRRRGRRGGGGSAVSMMGGPALQGETTGGGAVPPSQTEPPVDVPDSVPESPADPIADRGSFDDSADSGPDDPDQGSGPDDPATHDSVPPARSGPDDPQ
jgi:hypothetical protein